MSYPLKQQIALTLRSPRTAVNVLSDRLLGRQGNRYPRLIDLFVTERCNFSCPMCHVEEARQKKDVGKGMPFEWLEKIVTESAPHSPTFQIIGGEPTLYHPLCDLLALISRHRMISGVTTNGLRLPEMAAEMVGTGLNFLAVSLDGWDEESQFQRGRVKGSFAKIIHGIEEILKARGQSIFPALRIATVITRNNFRNLEEMAKVVTELRVDRWSISHYYFATPKVLKAQRRFLKMTGVGEDIWCDPLDREEGYFTPEEAEEIRVSLQSLRERYTGRLQIDHDWGVDPRQFYSTRYPTKESNCVVPFNEVFIRGNGNIELCQGYPIGHVENGGVSQAWNSEAMAHFREVFTRYQIMPGCFRCCALDIQFRNPGPNG